MKLASLLIFAFLFVAVPSTFAQGLPPLAPPPKPIAQPTNSSLSVEAANADLKTARAANQEKRYADAETLMLRDTAARPGMPYLWIELGAAQLGLKKYPEAETSFKQALGGNEPGQKPQAVPGAFYVEGKGTVGHISVATTPAGSDSKNQPEIEGMAYSNLGEIYIRTNKLAEAQAAFDKAVSAYPSQAALYLRNETIFFLQTGNSVQQVEAATKAIAIDPTRAALYFYKGQGLAAQATVDPKTQKLILPAGCADALQKYLDLDPTGQYSADAKGMLIAAGVTPKTGKK
jgi:tetratricopeptide (TPR) repeat protein